MGLQTANPLLKDLPKDVQKIFIIFILFYTKYNMIRADKCFLPVVVVMHYSILLIIILFNNYQTVQVHFPLFEIIRRTETKGNHTFVLLMK